MTESGTAATPEVDLLDTAEAGPRAVRGGAFRIGTYAVSMLLSLVAVPPMVRHLGALNYGYYVAAGSVVLIVAALTEAGITTIALREYAQRDRAARDAMLRSIVSLRVVLTVVAVLVAALLLELAGDNPAVVEGVMISGVGLVVQIVAETYTVPFQAELRLGFTATLDLIAQVVRTALIIGLVVLGAGLLPFFWVTAFAAGASLIVVVTTLRRRVSVRPSIDLAEWKGLLRDALPYAAAGAIGILYFRTAVILMSLTASGRQTGYYSAAFRIVEILVAIPWLVITAAFPILARAARDDHERLAYGL